MSLLSPHLKSSLLPLKVTSGPSQAGPVTQGFPRKAVGPEIRGEVRSRGTLPAVAQAVAFYDFGWLATRSQSDFAKCAFFCDNNGTRFSSPGKRIPPKGYCHALELRIRPCLRTELATRTLQLGLVRRGNLQPRRHHSLQPSRWIRAPSSTAWTARPEAACHKLICALAANCPSWISTCSMSWTGAGTPTVCNARSVDMCFRSAASAVTGRFTARKISTGKTGAGVALSVWLLGSAMRSATHNSLFGVSVYEVRARTLLEGWVTSRQFEA